MTCKFKNSCNKYSDNSYTCNYASDKSYCGYYKSSKFKYSFILTILLLSIILSIVGVSAIGTYPAVDPDMVLYYHFNNQSAYGENDTRVYDFSNGHLNNGTGNNTIFQANTGILNDGSMYFNGVNSSIYSNSSIINYPFSFSVWINKTYLSTGQIIGLVDRTQANRYYTIGIDSSNHYFIEARNQTIDSINTSSSSINSISLGNWYYFTAVFSNSTDRKLYVNGKLVLTSNTPVSFLSSANSSLIGSLRLNSPTNFFTGYIDEPIIYNISLNSSTILNNYANYIDHVGEYKLNYNDSLINITYSIFPYNDVINNPYNSNINFFNSIKANVSYNSLNYYFTPFTGGFSLLLNNTYFNFDSSNLFIKNISLISNNSRYYLFNYTYSNGLSDLSCLINYSIYYKELHIKVISLDGNDTRSFYAIRPGSTGGEQYKDIWIDRLPDRDDILFAFKKKSIFFGIRSNLSYSNAIYPNTYNEPYQNNNISILGNTGAVYMSINSTFLNTGGLRKGLNEEFIITISDNYFDLYDNLPKSVCSSCHSMDNNTIISTYEHTYQFNLSNADLNYFSIWDSLGFKDIIFNYRGSDYINNQYSATSYPIPDSSGGNNALIKVINDLKKYNYKPSIYFYSGDFYDFNSFFDYSKLSINSTGQYSVSLLNNYMSPPKIAYNPQYYYIYLHGLNHSTLLYNLGVTNFYMDVLTARSNFVDYNYSNYYNKPYSEFNGSLKYQLYYTQDIFDYIKNNLSVVTWAEGSPTGNPYYHSNPDYFFGHRALTDCKFFCNYPDVSLKYTRLSAGMVSTRGATGEYSRQKLSGISDNILFFEVPWIYTLSTSGWDIINITRYYYLINAIQTIQQPLNKSDLIITYYDNNSNLWYSFSDYLRNETNNFSYYKYTNPIIKINNSQGLNIIVNKGINLSLNINYNSVNYTVFPNMSIIWDNNNFFEYFNDTYYIVNSSKYLFLFKNNNYFIQLNYLPTINRLSGIDNINLSYAFKFNNVLILSSTNKATICNDCNFTLNSSQEVYVYREDVINDSKLWSNLLAYDYINNKPFLSSNINDNDGYYNNSNLFNYTNNQSILLDNFNVSETYRQYSPIWFSSSTTTEKHIASNLTDSVDVTVVLPEISCNDINHIRYTPYNETASIDLYENTAIDLCNQLRTTGYILKINPSSESNILTLDYSSSRGCRSFLTSMLVVIPFLGLVFLVLLIGVALYFILSALSVINVNLGLEDLDYYKVLIGIFIALLIIIIVIGVAYSINEAMCRL